jgi:hypothetical protein
MGARNIIRLLGDALIGSDKFDVAVGETLTVAPAVDNQGSLVLGPFSSIELNANTLSILGAAAIQRKVTDIAANTTLTVANGANGIITNRGATGAVQVTLPDDAAEGDWFQYHGVADQNILFKSETADTLVAGLNDAAADHLSFETPGELIGATAVGVFDGTQWHVQAIIGTATIVTA